MVLRGTNCHRVLAPAWVVCCRRTSAVAVPMYAAVHFVRLTLCASPAIGTWRKYSVGFRDMGVPPVSNAHGCSRLNLPILQCMARPKEAQALLYSSLLHGICKPHSMYCHREKYHTIFNRCPQSAGPGSLMQLSMVQLQHDAALTQWCGGAAVQWVLDA